MLFFVNKMSLCTHKYSCFERSGRILVKVFGSYSFYKIIKYWRKDEGTEESGEVNDSMLDLIGL